VLHTGTTDTGTTYIQQNNSMLLTLCVYRSPNLKAHCSSNE